MIYCNSCLVSLHSCHSILQIVTGSRDVNIILGFTREDILISNTLRKRPIWKKNLLTSLKASRYAWIRIVILIAYVNTIVFITQGNYIGYMFRLLNSHLQAYSLQVKSQDTVHTLGSQCVFIYFTDVNTPGLVADIAGGKEAEGV